MNSTYATWRQAWQLLAPDERRKAMRVLLVIVVAALFSAVTVVSILPFLTVLADPGKIHQTRAFARLYEMFGFTSDYGFLIALGIGSLAVIVLANAVQMLKVYAIISFGMIQAHLNSYRLLGRYLCQPYEFFLDSHTGDMSKSVLSESGQVVNQFYRPLAELVAALLSALAILAVVIWVNPLIAGSALLLLGGIYAVIYGTARAFLRRIGQERVRLNAQRFRTAGEVLSGIKDVKLLGRENAYLHRYEHCSEAMARKQAQMSFISGLPQFVVQSVAFGGIILLCLLLVDRPAYESGAPLGDLLPLIGVFAFAGQRLLPELAKIYNTFSKLQYGLGVIESITEDFERTAQGRPLPEVPPAGLGLRDRLEFDHVGYSYPNAEGAGVRDASFTLRRGERIGIVGGTGAGKTTLADIMLGLLEPQTGEMRADGTPITAGNLRAWQQSVGYVPQDIFLTDSSITENIALGVPPAEIDRDRAIRCAQLAQLHGFITTELPAGYDTTVGERGVRLSGGQRQRIGIARALYHDADMIVFDEATSALDTLTERDVMEAIAALPGDKTIVMIAHRLSTVRQCDRIIVMEHGRVAGFDSWENLLAENAPFRRIVDAGAGSPEAARTAIE
jgi:ABC-type multidrug transport system fused ATPase/permease subunit